MLAKIISALALTLLLTGGAVAYIPQPDKSMRVKTCLRRTPCYPSRNHTTSSIRVTAYSRSKVCGLSCFRQTAWYSSNSRTTFMRVIATVYYRRR